MAQEVAAESYRIPGVSGTDQVALTVFPVPGFHRESELVEQYLH